MSKPRVLILGAGGFLGSYTVKAAIPKAEVLCETLRSLAEPGTLIDICDRSCVDRAFRANRPDAVVLLAAMSDIDRCERHPDQAYAVNVRGAENVAHACAEIDARLLYVSTAAVFDGSKHGYSEEDHLCPVNVYGQTKAEAERIVEARIPSAVIVRISLALGWAPRTGTNSMLNAVHTRWSTHQPVQFPVYEIRNPIDAKAAANALIALLLHSHARGVYHIGACDAMSRYEIGKRLAALAGVSESLVQPAAAPPAGRAPRGADHFLLTANFDALMGVKGQTCEQVIERCFHEHADCN